MSTLASRTRVILVEGVVIAVVVLLGAMVIRAIAYAGSLTPSDTPDSATMNSAGETYNALTGTSFSSAGIAASSSGSAIQLAKCIITNLTGGSCP